MKKGFNIRRRRSLQVCFQVALVHECRCENGHEANLATDTVELWGLWGVPGNGKARRILGMYGR